MFLVNEKKVPSMLARPARQRERQPFWPDLVEKSGGDDRGGGKAGGSSVLLGMWGMSQGRREGACRGRGEQRSAGTASRREMWRSRHRDRGAGLRRRFIFAVFCSMPGDLMCTFILHMRALRSVAPNHATRVEPRFSHSSCRALRLPLRLLPLLQVSYH